MYRQNLNFIDIDIKIMNIAYNINFKFFLKAEFLNKFIYQNISAFFKKIKNKYPDVLI